MDDIRILVTGFEAFGGETYNPSEVILNTIELPETYSLRSCASLKKLLLPVTYRGAREILQRELSEFKPTHVLSIGQAGGRAKVTPEFCALNIQAAQIPDNDGVDKQGEIINSSLENAFFSVLPLNDYVSRVENELNIPCSVSYHAGTYVCNTVYFTLFEYANHAKSAIHADAAPKILFVHVPYTERQLEGKPAATPMLPFESSRRAVNKLLELMLENK